MNGTWPPFRYMFKAPGSFSSKEELRAYVHGIQDCADNLAIWKDGTQFVGTSQYPIKDWMQALREYYKLEVGEANESSP
jgi:hypothetical protein